MNKFIFTLFLLTTLFQEYCFSEHELLKERCEEAALPNSNAACYPEKGRIYVYDPEVKGFDEARRWCRQKMGGLRMADLISIESCDEFSQLHNIIEPFISSDRFSRPQDWIWTQIISGPRISRNSSMPDIIMEHLNGNSGFPSSELSSNCLKDVLQTDGDTTSGNILILLINGSSIKPKLIQRTLESKGHALCEYRFKIGSIDIPEIDIPTSSTTEETTTKQPAVTQQPEIIIPTNPPKIEQNVTTSYPIVDYNKVVDDFFQQIIQNISYERESSNDLASVILDNIQSDDFVLSTPQHIEKTVRLAQKLNTKIDSELSKITNKSVILSERITFTQHVCTILSTLMETKNDQCWEASETKKTPVYASQIISTTEKVGLKLACELEENGNLLIDAEKIQMEVFAFENQDYSELSFPSKQSVSSQIAEIKFPSGIDLETIRSASTCGRPSGLGTIYKRLSSYMDPVEEKMKIASDMVSFSFGDQLHDLDVQVSLSLKTVKRRGDVVQCVFWDPINTVWNSTGCVYDEISSTRRKTVCRCSHLTNFAILMDISGRQEDNQMKSIVTLVCLTTSAISLILTLFFLIALPPTKSSAVTTARETITKNLCICLLIADLLLMFGVEYTENILLCRVISATLFYFLAAVFTWMFLEGYFLYQMIVVVPLAFACRRRYLYLIGYGLAMIWLGATMLAINFSSFYDDKSYYCWISNSLYPRRIWFFIGPVSVIILLNLLIYIKSNQIALLNLKKKKVATRGSRPDQKNSQDYGLLRRWLKGSCSLLVLLGLTWIIGFLYFNESVDWISYVFIVINGSQGVFIFFFEIVTNSKARPAIIRLISGKFPLTYISSFSKTSSTNPISSLSSRSSKLCNKQSGHESSKGISILATQSASVSERRKTVDTIPVIMELK